MPPFHSFVDPLLLHDLSLLMSFWPASHEYTQSDCLASRHAAAVSSRVCLEADVQCDIMVELQHAVLLLMMHLGIS